MWNLNTIRGRVRNRLAETSVVFWSDADIDGYINEGQRFIGSLTKGIPSRLTGTVNNATPYLTVAAAGVIGLYQGGQGFWSDGTNSGSVTPINMRDANALAPDWRNWRSAEPRWIVYDSVAHATQRRVYFVPGPPSGTSYTATVLQAIVPTDLSNDSDLLFGNEPTMEPYQGVVLNWAAMLALLRERFDQDAERFYGFVELELRLLGTDPDEIPSFRKVADGIQPAPVAQ